MISFIRQKIGPAIFFIFFFLSSGITSIYAQFEQLSIPVYPGPVSFEQQLLDFGDPSTGYYTAHIYFSPSSGAELWFYLTLDGGNTWIDKATFWYPAGCTNKFVVAINHDTCFISYTDPYYAYSFLRITNGGHGYYSFYQSLNETEEPRCLTNFNDSALFLTLSRYNNDPYGIFSVLYRIDAENMTELFEASEDSLVLLKPIFISRDTGFIISRKPAGEDYAVLKTTDGGLSLQSCFSTGSLEITDIDFFNHNIGMITCSGGHLFKTTDGGLNWRAIDPGIADRINCLDLVNERTGYFGGDNGNFYRTNDQGESWSKLGFPSETDILRIKMFKEAFGYISCHETFFRYSDTLNNVGGNETIPVRVYPNPAKDLIRVELSSNIINEAEIFVINAVGEVILNKHELENEFNIDLSGFNKGIYFLIVKTGEKRWVIRIIRQ